MNHMMVHPLEWHLLAPLYEQRHRVYHDIQHIHSMLRRIDEIEGLSPDEASWLEAVAWLHDAYFDPLSKMNVNEERSAALLNGPLGGAFTPAGLQLARRTILATANHLEDQENVPFLMGLFLDLDIANISDDFVDFSEQSIRISEEFLEAGVSPVLVEEGQAQFAEKMLARKKIFYSPPFRGREGYARKNLGILLTHPAAFLSYDNYDLYQQGVLGNTARATVSP